MNKKTCRSEMTEKSLRFLVAVNLKKLSAVDFTDAYKVLEGHSGSGFTKKKNFWRYLF